MTQVRVVNAQQLVFGDGSPVHAASAVARLDDGWLIAQDDSTFAAWWRGGTAEAIRVLPPVDGVDSFRSSDGTKDLKPDLEGACGVTVDGRPAALLLGSGSLPRRMRAALVFADDRTVRDTALDPLYPRIAAELGLRMEALNLEGACVADGSLRLFQRGHVSGVASASLDVDLDALLAVLVGGAKAGDVALSAATVYDLGEIDGVPLAVTDAVRLPGGRIVVSAAAEDSPDAVADGPIVGSALAVLDGTDVAFCVELPRGSDGSVRKVEGLAVREATADSVVLLAVVDQDDPDEPSVALTLELELDAG